MKNKLIAMLVCLAMIVPLAGCTAKADGEKSDSKTTETTVKAASFEELNLAVGTAPGPVTYPLAQMTEQNSNIVLKPWQSGEQLTAMLTSKEVQLCSTPISNALLCYNKGLNTKLLMVTVWGMLYVMSSENEVASLQDLKGKEVVLSGQGGIHDLIFRHILIKNNINPETDLTLTYMDMSEASTMLASGAISYAVLNEPQSSIASLNAAKSGVTLNRVMDLTEEWGKLPGQENARFPMAGIVVVADSGITPEQVAGFEEAYIETADWVAANPEAIGPIVEKYVPTMKAAAVTQSLKYARLQPEPAIDCMDEVEAFFKELSQTADMKAFGGKLPDEGFYYQNK